jgi:coproporphyrinogen III oxidase
MKDFAEEKQRARDWFESLQLKLIAAMETIEQESTGQATHRCRNPI